MANRFTQASLAVSSGLRVFGSSGLRVFGSSGLRVFGLMAAASLALAACGGGDSTVQPPQPQRTPVEPPPDCTMEPRPAGCPPPPPPVTPMPFAGLGGLETSYAAAAIKKTRFGIEQYPIYLYENEETMQITSLRHRPLTNTDDRDRLRGQLTKVVKVTPSGDIDYEFELWHTGLLVTDSGSFTRGGFKEIARSEALDDSRTSDKLFSIGKDDYTAKNIDFDFEEPYNVMKDYQILTAEVDTNKDNEKDATLHAELWTDYSSSNTNDYLGGGFWLLAPKDVQDNAGYVFGGFVRSQSKAETPTRSLTGQATYKGAAAGLHTSLENNTAKISRLLGKVTMTIDFEGTGEQGNVDGRIHDLTLDGKVVRGELLLERDIDSKPVPVPNWGIGNINGINYTGQWDFSAITSRDVRSVVGTIGGTGSNGNTVVATFGARKVEEE